MNYKDQLKRTKETNHFMLHNNIKATMLTEDQARDGRPRLPECHGDFVSAVPLSERRSG